MTDLLALADRAEKATGPDRLIDNLIWVALAPGDKWLIGHEDGRFPQKPIYGTRSDMLAWLNGVDGHALDGALPSERYTASLDSAMTLVPEGQGIGWQVSGGGSAGVWRVSNDPDDYDSARFPDPLWQAGANAATPALALVAAALRARHAEIEERVDG